MNMQEHSILTHNLLKTLDSEGKAELIETHISTIILCGDFVYKLKKPVDFGFLDYSTLKKRHKYALEELRINQAFAPRLYLGVVPITGTIETPLINGGGRVLDYAVKMRRFDQSEQLDNIVERNGLEIESMGKIAELVARFHEAAVPVSPQSDYGAPQRVLLPMQENFDLLQPLTKKQSLNTKLKIVKAWTYEQFGNLKPLLTRRKSEGFVRACHGDMHLHNMALHEGELILFDAIEFNDYLSHIDVINDLAFLLMDLEYRGLTRHSRILLNDYLELTGDYGGAALLDFYKTYRAMVRAKVTALRIAQMAEPDERKAAMDEVNGYIDQALSYTRKKDPFLAIMHGFSGSGKSTCALKMVETYGVLRIRSDVERMRMFGKDDSDKLKEGIYTPEATKATYYRLQELAMKIIQGGIPVVLDATFLKKWQRQLFWELSSEANVPFFILDLQCDTEILRHRIKKRSAEGIDISEANLDVLEMQLDSAEPLSAEETEKRLVLDCSTMESMERSIDTLNII